MTRSRSSRLKALLISLAATLMGGAISVGGCTGQGDIDRTQPDKIDKSILFDAATGLPKVWYYRETTVGAPLESNWAFEGIQTQMDKVRFVITEKFLEGYRAYDYVPGSQNDFTSGSSNTDTPVLQYAITSHFDVKREYNAGTGEQTNVISENTTDRPWDQRQFMRVDWGFNQVNPNTNADPSTGMPVGYTQTGFMVSEADVKRPDFADRPIYSGDYIDFVGMQNRQPDILACANFYPFVDDGGPWNCGNAQIKTRYSLLAVKPSTYQPLDYPDNKQLVDKDGNPIQLIAGSLPCSAEVIARSGGQYSGADCTPATMGEFSKFGYFRTVIQTYDRREGVTEAGREYFANRWNIWNDSVMRNPDGAPMRDATGATMPLAYSDRTIKPIVYYTNVEFPDDPMVWDQAKAVVGDWNDAMKKTVVSLRGIEASKTPGLVYTPDRMQMDLAKMTEDVVVLKQNSCNLAGLQALLKTYPDLDSQVELATGLAGASLDTTHLTQACSVVEAATQGLKDGDPKKFSWQRNGDLRYSFLFWVDRPQPSGPLGYGPSSADPETGEIISASAYLYGAALDVYAQTAADTVDLLNNDISIDNLLSGKTITDVLHETAAARKATSAQPLTAAAQAKASALLGGTGATYSSGLPRLLPLPSGITSSQIQSIAGTAVEQLMTDQNIVAAKLPQLKPGDTPSLSQLSQASPASWLSDSARQARQQRFQTLAMNGCVYMGEFADEAIIGLALQLKQQGLAGDALFKALRKLIFRGLADHEMGHTMGLRHNFSGSSDALNYADMYWTIRSSIDPAKWNDNRMSEYQYSTVMDYGSRFNSDVQGLGKYDYAAIRFGYGQLIDVMPQGALGPTLNTFDLQNHIFTDDYTKLPATLGGVDNLTDGGVMSYDYSTTQFQGYYQGLLPTGGSTTGIDQNALRERPFLFCSDEYIGNLTCKQWDFGANQREIVDDAIDRYKNYYFFSAFKRGKLNWSIDGYLNRLLERYFIHYTEAFQFYYFFGSFLNGLDLGNDLFLASVDSLNALGEVLQTPEPGLHCTTQLSPDVMVLPSATGANACASGGQGMDIEPPDGKPYFIDFSPDYYYRITRTGSLYEKLAAIISLTSTQARFYRVDTFADSSNYSINYYRFFKDEMLGLLSGVIKDDPSLYAGYISGGFYTPTPVVDLSIWGNVNPATPAYQLPGVPRVDTPVNKTIQYYALGLSLANLDTTWDATLDIGSYMAVTLKGSNDDVTYGASTVVHEYTHPQSGLTYRAPQFDARTGVGVQLVDELNLITGKAGVPGTLPARFGALSNGQPLPDWQTAKANMDALVGGTDQQAYNTAQSVFKFVDFQVSNRVDLLGDLRLFRKSFGY